MEAPPNEPMQVTDPDAFVNLLRDILSLHPAGLSEYDLLQRLRQDTAGEATGIELGTGRCDDSHNLFRTHFLLFHHLYRLREQLVGERTGDLDIHTLCIRWLPPRAGDGQQLGQADPLRAYYLDLNNLVNTTREDVDQMLGRFWSRFSRDDRRHEALATLDLPADADEESIRQQYRRLAMRHHPDRGGDAGQLQAINAAMAILLPRSRR